MEIPPVKIERILFATDLSESARYAFGYALAIAGQHAAAIIVLHVMEDLPGLEEAIRAHIGEAQWKAMRAKREENARSILIGKKRDSGIIQEALVQLYSEHLGSRPHANVSNDEIMIEKGVPIEQIMRCAEEKKCDLIIVGHHGHAGLLKSLIGSTAAGLVKRSRIPVLVVRLPEES
jgi:nucleotide-binding universal stress UspA family protein